MRSWDHTPLCGLKKLPRECRFWARHTFPLHRHHHCTFLAVPPAAILEEALKAYDARPFRFASPDPDLPFEDQLTTNMQAYNEAGQPLGRPWPIASGVQVFSRALDPPVLIEKPEPPSLECHPPSVDLLATPHTPMVYTYSGWRPLAGNFKRHLSEWHRFPDLVPPAVFADLGRGVHLDWEDRSPPPLWLKNHRLTDRESLFVTQEVEALLLTQAIQHYELARWGMPYFVGPLHVTEDSSGSLRLIWDPRYVNGHLRPHHHLTLEQLETLSLYIEKASLLLKLDLKAGYHHLLLRTADSPFLCFEWQGTLYCWRALAFGLSNAPFRFERVMKALKAVFRAVFLRKFLGYLDDMNFVFPPSPPLEPAALLQAFLNQARMAPHAVAPVTVMRELIRFGGVINSKKILSMWPRGGDA